MKIEISNEKTESRRKKSIVSFENTNEAMNTQIEEPNSKLADMKKGYTNNIGRLLNLNKESLYFGIIWAEILDRPKGLRRR